MLRERKDKYHQYTSVPESDDGDMPTDSEGGKCFVDESVFTHGGRVWRLTVMGCIMLPDIRS